MALGGRDREGSNASGSIGEVDSGVELIHEPEKKKPSGAGGGDLGGFLGRKGLGVGLLVVLAGVIVSLKPYVEFLLLPRIQALSTGPQLIAYGVLIIVAAWILKLVLPPILSLLAR